MSLKRKRIIELDIARAILIVLVVIGHYNNSIVHTIIYWFHMPAFFFLTGYTIEKTKGKVELKHILYKQYIPFFFYAIVIVCIFQRNNLFLGLLKIIWGGRLLPGVFWFTNCYIIATWLFQEILGKVHDDRKVFSITSGLFLLGIIESNIVRHYEILKYMLLPWSFDIAFIAIEYVAIGYYSKHIIITFLTEKSRKVDVVAVCALLVCAVLVFFEEKQEWHYAFDMKQLEYTNLILSLCVPIFFTIIILRLAHIVSYSQMLKKLFSYIGKNTLPIMYLHLPLLEELQKYKRLSLLSFLIIGILVPLVVNYCIKMFQTIIKRMRGIVK